MTETGKERGLRLFLSADLAGSTAYKQNTPPDEWQQFFRSFYRQLPARVIHHAEACGAPGDLLKVWKLIGDEVVFSRLLTGEQEAAQCVRVFRAALEDFREATLTATKGGLDIKAAGWTAGFPVGNIRVEPMEGLGEDFVGPGMDIGFRLVKAASPRRMLVSVELAWLLTLPSCAENLRLFMDSGLDLKGVARGLRYPCIWLDNFADQLSPREADQLHLLEEKVRGTTPQLCCMELLHKYCQQWLEQWKEPSDPPFFVPFIEGGLGIGKPSPRYEGMFKEVIQESEQATIADREEPNQEGLAASKEVLAAFDEATRMPPQEHPRKDASPQE